MTELEQRVELSEQFPTVEEYLHRRLGSSAVDVSTAVVEYVLDFSHEIRHFLIERRYCFGIEIPSSVMYEHDMKMIWQETNIIISVYVSKPAIAELSKAEHPTLKGRI